jgi:hypothetical protein
MKRFLLVTVLTIAASPAFADQLFDNCYALATERVGHVSQTAHGHFQTFVRQCMKGAIPLPGPAAASVSAGQRSRTPTRASGQGGYAGGEGEGRIQCVAGSDGQKHCY